MVGVALIAVGAPANATVGEANNTVTPAAPPFGAAQPRSPRLCLTRLGNTRERQPVSRGQLSKNDQAILAVVYETGEVMDADRLRGILELIEKSLDEPGVAGTDLAGGAYAAGPRFRELAVSALQQGRGEETFLDATCEPPQTFSYGGVLAHVLTFSAVRRTMAIGALESYGVNDLGAGDPMAFVGGTGDDASTIQRRWS